MTSPAPPPYKETGPYGRNDPLPCPEATEHDSETIWHTFQALQASQDRGFAKTQPISGASHLPGRPSGHAPLPAPHPARTAVQALEALLRECRRDNRVCPMPQAWQALYELLPGKRTAGQWWDPPPPITGPAWHATGAIAKRVALRTHLE